MRIYQRKTVNHLLHVQNGKTGMSLKESEWNSTPCRDGQDRAGISCGIWIRRMTANLSQKKKQIIGKTSICTSVVQNMLRGTCCMPVSGRNSYTIWVTSPLMNRLRS